MPADDVELRRLIQICDLFHEAGGPTIPLAMVEAFLLVALYEGASLKDLCRLSGQAQSTLSRHLLDLGDHNRKGGPGLKLVAWRRPTEEERRKEYFLTPKGRVLRDRLLRDPGHEGMPEVHFSLASGATAPGYRSTAEPRTRRTRVKGTSSRLMDSPLLWTTRIVPISMSCGADPAPTREGGHHGRDTNDCRRARLVAVPRAPSGLGRADPRCRLDMPEAERAALVGAHYAVTGPFGAPPRSHAAVRSVRPGATAWACPTTWRAIPRRSWSPCAPPCDLSP